MILKTFVKGMLDDNNYLLIDENSKEAVLIDCSDYISELKDVLDEFGANLKYILITHSHFDHVMGINEFHEKFPNTQVLVPLEDKELLEYIDVFVTKFVGGLGHVEIPHVDKFINENDKIFIGNQDIRVISTPGHTKGGVCYFIDDKLFSGDTIFLGSVGRTDLPGGNFEQLRKSVKNVLDMFDDETPIYAGHGPSTTVGYEKLHNPVL